MRGDATPRDSKGKKLPLSRRALWIMGLVALAILGGSLAWRHINNPPRPWLVRWKLDRYLKKQAHTGNFKVDFPFPSKAEMAAPVKSAARAELAKGSRTGKDFDTLRDEYLALKTAAVQLEQNIVRGEVRIRENTAKLDLLTKQITDGQTSGDAATNVSTLETNATTMRAQIAAAQKLTARRPELESKEQTLAPIVDDLWDFQRNWAPENAAGASDTLAKARAEFVRSIELKLENASSYEAMYSAIGQELFVAKRLLESGNPAHRRMGVTVAFAAGHHALDYAMNGNVATRICEGYILPNIDLATDTNRRSAFNEEGFVNECAALFRRNNEFNNVVRTYEMYLKKAKNQSRADWARSQIAAAHEQGGNLKEAIAAIRQIQDTNTYSRLIRRIPRLQQDADMKR